MIKVAINGFGRIGRASFKIALQKSAELGIEIVAINDLTNLKILAYLLKYDTAYGIYDKSVAVEETDQQNYLVVNGHKVQILSEKDPEKLPWSVLGGGVDVVLECTGRFTETAKAMLHIKAGARKVLISAPASGTDTPTVLLGVNQDSYNGEQIVSNASCTTNCISPIVSVMHKRFGIIKAIMTTIHAVTAEQNVVDGPPPSMHPDLRRARASGFNMIPTTTGAAKATTQAITELKNKFDGIAIRVPIITGSLSDITMLTAKKTSIEEVNSAFLEAKTNFFYKGVLDATYEPIVSSDIIGSSFSTIVDLSMTKVVDGDLVKVLAWYDNEWGYSNRLVEMIKVVSPQTQISSLI